MSKKTVPQNFIQQMQSHLSHYQLEKALRLEGLSKVSEETEEQYNSAKQTLIEVDDEHDLTHTSEEESAMGRWAHYQVPTKV